MQESQDFDARWRSRVSEFEASVATQLCNLKQQHEKQLTELLVRCETERPNRPQHSAEILNGRKIEEALVKQVRTRAAVDLHTESMFNEQYATKCICGLSRPIHLVSRRL